MTVDPTQNRPNERINKSGRRHQMETFYALLAICEGNSPATGEFPSQRPLTRSIDVFSDLRPNKRLSEQSRRRWFGTQSRPLWRHCNMDTRRVWSIRICYNASHLVYVFFFFRKIWYIIMKQCGYFYKTYCIFKRTDGIGLKSNYTSTRLCLYVRLSSVMTKFKVFSSPLGYWPLYSRTFPNITKPMRSATIQYIINMTARQFDLP